MPFTYTVRTRITLARLKRSKRILRAYMEQHSHVRIGTYEPDVSRVRGVPLVPTSWWRAKASGYTGDVAEAGLYNGEDAVQQTFHCGPEKGIMYEVLEQHDTRTQEEMPKPRLRFKGYRTAADRQPVFEWDVSQIMSQGREGKSLDFTLRAHWNTHTNALKYSVDIGADADSLEQLGRWHRAIAYALANLPPPVASIPLW